MYKDMRFTMSRAKFQRLKNHTTFTIKISWNLYISTQRIKEPDDKNPANHPCADAMLNVQYLDALVFVWGFNQRRVQNHQAIIYIYI